MREGGFDARCNAIHDEAVRQVARAQLVHDLPRLWMRQAERDVPGLARHRVQRVAEALSSKLPQEDPAFPEPR